MYEKRELFSELAKAVEKYSFPWKAACAVLGGTTAVLCVLLLGKNHNA